MAYSKHIMYRSLILRSNFLYHDKKYEWEFFYVHVTVNRNKFLFNKTNRRTNFPNLFCQENLHFSGSSSAHHQEFSTVHSALVYVIKKLYMFRPVPLPIIRSFPLYIRHWYMSCRFDDSFQARPSWS